MDWADEVEEDGTFVPNDEDAEALKVAAELEEERRKKEAAAPAPPPQPKPSAPPPQQIKNPPKQNPWGPRPPMPGGGGLGGGGGGLGGAGAGGIGPSAAAGGGAASSRWKNHMKNHDEAMAKKRERDRVELEAKLVARATADTPGGPDWRWPCRNGSGPTRSAYASRRASSASACSGGSHAKRKLALCTSRETTSPTCPDGAWTSCSLRTLGWNVGPSCTGSRAAYWPRARSGTAVRTSSQECACAAKAALIGTGTNTGTDFHQCGRENECEPSQATS
ncbi:Hypothetical Protein FCC1311_101322 [Hondaea fermentalgiana]|uniref:Uncharacterized protein n=1 Tax=Hondaea fermentalgiana TaxID=2315210 RepID=A0A2R5GUB0_9STRA|nr:Hypothetical Protein FCC1311_101322 [Hondaea fermentalgiana]|eukprot:GBG33909.1 Hypothetical Protein FCC1311_101322 [Hondaea fermentalgiana]